MRIALLPLMALLNLMLSGCAATSKTADEFRSNVSAFIMPNIERFEVNRPFKDVAATFEKLAPKCLDKTVQRARGMHYKEIVNWNPTVIAGNDKLELHLQSVVESGNIDIENKGDFSILVDAAPLAGNKTSIAMYISSKYSIDFVVDAIKAWAEGENTKCPDMTKI